MNKKKKQRREFVGTPRNPKGDYDNFVFKEIPMSNEELDEVIHREAKHLEIDRTFDVIAEELRVRKRRERLLNKIFKAASKVLTDTQFKIFVMKNIYNLQEEDIAAQLPQGSQEYVQLVLRKSYAKIKRELRLTEDHDDREGTEGIQEQ